LFKNLSRLKESLKTCINLNYPNNDKRQVERNDDCGGKILPFHKESLKSQLDECLKRTSECANSLFDLTLLVPSAPWVDICLEINTHTSTHNIIYKL
jgi:hypothetical protein